MKNLIVHIGPYKTGSTAIQRVLAAGRRDLESASILYPTSRKTLPLEAHHSLARFLRTGPGPGISLVFGPDELAATLRSTKADHVVLSSEGFSNPSLAASKVATLAELAQQQGFSMTAVAFIRPQAEMMNSWYVQDVKDLRRPGSFAEFAAADNAWLEHTRRFTAWSSQPLVRFVAVPFNGEARGARIAELMLRAGGVPDEQVARARLKPAEVVNENPGYLTVAGLRYLMQHHPWTRELEGPRLREARESSFVEARGRGWFAQPFTGVDADQAERIAARFAADNEAFAEQHWQRSWHDVFASDAARRWVSNEIDPDRAAADVVDELATYANTFVEAVPGMPKSGRERGRARRPAPPRRAKRGSGNPAKQSAPKLVSPAPVTSKQAADGAAAFGFGPPVDGDAAEAPAVYELPKELKDLL